MSKRCMAPKKRAENTWNAYQRNCRNPNMSNADVAADYNRRKAVFREMLINCKECVTREELNVLHEKLTNQMEKRSKTPKTQQ